MGYHFLNSSLKGLYIIARWLMASSDSCTKTLQGENISGLQTKLKPDNYVKFPEFWSNVVCIAAWLSTSL